MYVYHLFTQAAGHRQIASMFALWIILQGLRVETALQEPNFNALDGYYRWDS